MREKAARFGDRRTVVGREGPVFAGVEFGGFFDVPQRLSIKKSASYGFPWNQIRNFCLQWELRLPRFC